MPGAKRTVRGSVMARSAIADLVSSRPPVMSEPVRIGTPVVCIQFASDHVFGTHLVVCSTPYAYIVVSLKSPTHHTASMYVCMTCKSSYLHSLEEADHECQST